MIRFPKTAFEALQQHALKTFPEECGGLLLGFLHESPDCTTFVVAEVLRLENVRLESRHNRIEIDPLDYVKAERLALKKGLGIWGFYHSHPNAPAIPSEFDRQHFPFTNWWYPIVSVSSELGTVVRCWRLSDSREAFLEEAIDILDADAVPIATSS